jgi:hypothetical protein
MPDPEAGGPIAEPRRRQWGQALDETRDPRPDFEDDL